MTNDKSAEEIVRRIEEIRARCEAATPGPWAHNHIHTEWGDVHEALVPFKLGTEFGLEDAGHGNPSTDADCEFIARAREDIPYLLARIAELEGQLADKEAVNQLHLVTLRLVGADKDTAIHRMWKAEAQFAASQQETRAAVEFIQHLDREYSHYIADRGFERWRRPQEAGEKGN